MKKSKPDALQLATEFINSLTELLDASTIAKINELNASIEYQGVCASHDFCDPNQLMSDALGTFGFDYHPNLNDLINQAWEKAKAAKFSAANLVTGEVVKLATIRREYLDQYESDLTYVVLNDDADLSVIRALNFPDREPIAVPSKHLNVFDEFNKQVKSD